MRYENIWLYQFRGNEIVLRKGDAVSFDVPSYARFETGHGNGFRTLLIANEEGEVYNNMVWLKERNDQAAIIVFQKYKKEQILKITKSLDRARDELKYLEECKNDTLAKSSEGGGSGDCHFVQLL